MKPRLPAAAFLCALVIGACGSAHHASSTPAPASRVVAPSSLTPARCSSSQLALSYVGTQGATGHLEATFSLRNISARTCTLFGYPGAQMLDAGGAPVPTHLKRGNGFFPDTLATPRRVLLRPGGNAQFGLSFATNSEYVGGRPCPAATALSSVPPNAYQALHVELAGAGRPRFAPCGGVLVASPVYAG
jgi:hypothetical protein